MARKPPPLASAMTLYTVIYVGALMLVGVILEPSVIQDYVRIGLIAGVLLSIVWVSAIAYDHWNDPQKRLPTSTVVGMGAAWILPTAYVARDAFLRSGEGLGLPTLVLAITLALAWAWLFQLHRRYRRERAR